MPESLGIVGGSHSVGSGAARMYKLFYTIFVWFYFWMFHFLLHQINIGSVKNYLIFCMIKISKNCELV